MFLILYCLFSLILYCLFSSIHTWEQNIWYAAVILCIMLFILYCSFSVVTHVSCVTPVDRLVVVHPARYLNLALAIILIMLRCFNKQHQDFSMLRIYCTAISNNCVLILCLIFRDSACRFLTYNEQQQSFIMLTNKNSLFSFWLS